jgi:hypothetical protein
LPPASASTRSSPDVCGREEHQGQPPGTRTRRHAALLCLPQLLATLRLLPSSVIYEGGRKSVMQRRGPSDGAPPVAVPPSASRSDDHLLLGSRQ